MSSEDTSPSPRRYQVDPQAVLEFRRWLSASARASGASELDFHSFVFNHPELVACCLTTVYLRLNRC